MCKDNRITRRLTEGAVIDAPFPKNVDLAIKLLKKECGYQSDIDDIQWKTEYRSHLTTVKYKKTANLQKLGRANYFEVAIPNRYRPEGTAPEGVIRSEDDI